MPEQLPDFQRVMDDGTNTVSWTKLSGIESGDYFYIDLGLPTYVACIGQDSPPTATISGPGTKVTIRGSGMDKDTTYHVVGFHGKGVPRRFA